jgi:outer membrane protein assembly factor BamB
VYFGAGYVEAADANTGALIWKSDFYSGNQLTAPVISDNVLFIEDARNLYAVNINDGTLKWKFIYSGKLTNSTSGPTVADDRVICNNDGHGIYALSASTGKLQWTFTAEGLIYTNPCIVDSAGNAFYSGRAGNVN